MSLWGNTDTNGDEPKFGSALSDATSVTIEMYGVDATEQGVAAAGGSQFAPAHSGWVGISTHMDMHGNLRVKSETLVAMGSITGDQSDDTQFADS